MPKLKDIISYALNGEKQARKRLSRSVDESTPVDRVKYEMKNLVDAVDQALYRPNPTRIDLLTIYERAMTDPHVLSQVEIAKAKVCAEPFIVTKGGGEKQDLTTGLKKPWFENFLSICVDKQLNGYTLAEFGEIKDNGFTYCKTFPSFHVEPFSRQVLIRPTDRTGIPYGDNPTALYLVELGEPEDLGLLRVVARETIWKSFSRTDWSQCSEKYGMPLIWIKTGTDDAKELDRIEAMARNFASNGYIITDIEDDVKIVETNKSDIYKIYEMNARFCDEQISKCLNGQTGASDEKSFVGSAEVHERILDDFHLSRLRSITNIVNYQLFPFMAAHGLPFDGALIRFPALDEKTDKTPEQPLDPLVNPLALLNPRYQYAAMAMYDRLSKKKSLTPPDWVISMPTDRRTR